MEERCHKKEIASMCLAKSEVEEGVYSTKCLQTMAAHELRDPLPDKHGNWVKGDADTFY